MNIDTIPADTQSRVRSLVKTTDERQLSSAFEAYAAPDGLSCEVQIVRPYAVLSKSTYSAPVTPPIGPAYLAAVLEASGYHVGIIDGIGESLGTVKASECGFYNLQGLSREEIVDRIPHSAKIIGISMMFSQDWLEHRSLVREIRRQRPNVVIVAGGEHPTALPEYVLDNCPEIDFIVLGEGELSFLELVHSIFSGQPPDDIGGIAFRNDDGDVIQNGLSNRIIQIDGMPRPAWHLLDVEKFFVDNWTMGISMGRNMPILGTRGCPYQCTFCSNPLMWTPRYVMRAPADVVDEIEFLIETYQSNSIDFLDLTAIVKKQWIIAFCEELRRRNLSITWQLPSGTRSESLDRETLQSIYETGCRFLVYAPESGSQDSLNQIKKKLKLPRLIESVSEALDVGHTVKVNFIIGFPHERLRHVFETLWVVFRFALKGVHDCNIAIFTPYPGSELYEELRAENAIEDLSDQYFRDLIVQFDFTVARAFCRHVSALTLVILRTLGQSVFYVTTYLSHPSRLLNLFQAMRRKRFQASNLFEQRIFDFIVRHRLTSKR